MNMDVAGADERVPLEAFLAVARLDDSGRLGDNRSRRRC
jgi:hypothetical protein